MTPSRSPRLLLIGGGHAHVQVLRDWMAAPLAGVELTVVSPSAWAPYSGMVPGWLAGDYRFDQIVIDLAALCAAAHARLVIGEVAALDPTDRCVTLSDRQELAYDQLSLNIGSTLTPPELPGVRVLSMRPLGDLRRHWESTLAALGTAPSQAHAAPLRITAVGGGPAGAESLLAVCARLRREQPGRSLAPRLISRAPTLASGLAPGAVRRLQAALVQAGVRVDLKTPYTDAIGQACDLLLWAPGAAAHRWPADSGLAVDAEGFIRIDAQLRSVSHPAIHAVGDCAAWGANALDPGATRASMPLPKAGVFAVRMGPVLSANLRTALGHGEAIRYTPQRHHLVLLATGDGRAIASWGRWSAGGAFVGRALWRWKDRIDQAFLARFRLQPGATSCPSLPASDPPST